jgi:hypothetical protein
MSDRPTDEPDVIGRREFTLQSALALLAGVVITMDGCGGSTTTPSPTPTPSPAPAPPAADVNGSVSANHAQPHVAVITAARITAASAFALDIQGMATHPHTIEISQADLVSLRNRTAVSKESTNNNNHTHTVTFTPA